MSHADTRAHDRFPSGRTRHDNGHDFYNGGKKDGGKAGRMTEEEEVAGRHLAARTPSLKRSAETSARGAAGSL